MSVAVNVGRPRLSATGRRWYAQLWVHVVAGMIGGVLLGERLQPLGDAFVKAMRMLIAPIVFSTVVVGIANMGDMARVGRVALKALIYFEIMTTIALILGLVVVNLWQPGAGMHIDARGLANPGDRRTLVVHGIDPSIDHGHTRATVEQAGHGRLPRPTRCCPADPARRDPQRSEPR